jgi:hypothetical protein
MRLLDGFCEVLKKEFDGSKTGEVTIVRDAAEGVSGDWVHL